VPSSWPDRSAAQAGAPGASRAAELKWREFFTDPRLQSVIELALANNRDLRVATLNIQRVEAFYRIQCAELYPTIVASASGDAYRVPRTASGAADNETVAQYTVGLGMVSWEMDLFGRIRSLKTRALEQCLATGLAQSAAQISLISAVANTNPALAGDRENLKLAQETLDAQQASYDLILHIRDIGMTSDLDLRQAQSQVETARVDIADIRAR